ncbi:NAD-dependent epimerase/dehydratase family protein [Pseudomonas sp. FP597]|uniref:NAD-dependent epimerase/dehydratase family protein n=1 Tax=Pseudomonas sp. FP597 TaxID=2954096 RepID=UPI0027374BB4|nr:NAD-dependent epimerase/dehydratase family protein [Pseudomonas sp. FP597]WLI04503.1 NAD-dependent epimerase/dehydratase family protein [Pseudomonas sp. FP597]
MKILVTGGNGFVGRQLVKRLLDPVAQFPENSAIKRLTVVDMGDDFLPDDPRLHFVRGSIADATVLDAALDCAPDVVFHLASIPGGAAERNFELGLQVNLYATMELFQRLARQGNCPRVVFASTIAVYGSSLPQVVDEKTPLRPAMSYAAHKLAGEILLDDYNRQGLLDGRTLRLPGIVARPPEPSGLLSAFMSDLFWKLAAGEHFACPVSAKAVAWWMSVGCCVENLLHASRVSSEQLGARRVYTLPVLRLTIAQVVEGLCERYGENRRLLVDYQPNPDLERVFGSFPELDSNVAESIGFRNDGSVADLVVNATAWRDPA